MANAKDLGWGLLYEGIAGKAMWGARAIFTGRRVDFLLDRQGMIADDPAAKTLLMAKLNGARGANAPRSGALSKFKAGVDRGQIEVHDGETSDAAPVAEIDGVRFYASERASYGYLYVTAVLMES
jgi:hypothetical protein